MDARTNEGLTCITVKDIAEANEKSSGRRPKWRVDRSTSFDLNCPTVFRKMSLSNFEKTRIRNRNKRELKSNITLFPTRIINGKLTILAEKSQSFDISVYNLQGNLLKKFTKVSRQIDIDVSSLSPGLYVVKIHHNEQETIKKIIIGK